MNALARDPKPLPRVGHGRAAFIVALGLVPLDASAERPAPLARSHCEVQVDGVGLLDMERDYLPHVIGCENGEANLQALKAQAIAARSVAYHHMETSGSICDSQRCQVYSCSVTPSAIHYQAVEETSGVYLMHDGTPTYGFYVAGDETTSPPSCVGRSGPTEGWVTYNEGLAGTNVTQTTLGSVHRPGAPAYGQNRGCMSQWGARCLEDDKGYDYLGILRFYYGDDIELVQGEGACVLPLLRAETTPVEPGATMSEPGVGASGPAGDEPYIAACDDGSQKRHQDRSGSLVSIASILGVAGLLGGLVGLLWGRLERGATASGMPHSARRVDVALALMQGLAAAASVPLLLSFTRCELLGDTQMEPIDELLLFGLGLVAAIALGRRRPRCDSRGVHDACS